MRKTIGFSFIIALLAGSCFAILFFKNTITQNNFTKQPKETSAITLLFMGDIMFARGVGLQIQKQKNWSFPFLKIGGTLQKADFVFGNLESVISNKGTKVGSIYSFEANPKTVEGLQYAGFTAVSVANNHSLDYGRTALLDSISILQKAGITPVGAGTTSKEAYQVFIKEVRGTKIGILAYTNLGSPLWEASDTTAGIAWIDKNNLSQFKEQIANAKKQVDILAVSIHFGDEYQIKPNETQKLIAKTVIDAGANLIIGHHPHVVQPLEQYKQGWIAYSLGNFVFDQDFSEETMQGAILKVIVEDKKIEEISLLPTKLNSSFQVELAN